MNIGNQDQLYEGIKDIVNACSKFYNECKSNGFTDKQSFDLTMQFLISLNLGGKR